MELHLRVPRERFQNNVRLVLAVTGGLLLVFLIAELLLRKSRDFQPDFLASALLYGFTVLNLVLLLVLLFVLGRNLVRMLMEWRRGVFGARLRVQLLLIFLLMAAAPSVLLLFVGSDLIRQTVDRWFNVDVERLLASSQALGAALDASATETSRVHARLLAREIDARGLLLDEDQARLRRTIEARSRERDLDLVTVYGRERRDRVRDGPARAVGGVVGRLGRGSRGRRAARGREVRAWSIRGRAGSRGSPSRSTAPTASRRERSSCRRSWRRRWPRPSTRSASATTKFRQTQTYREPILAFYRSLYLFPALLLLFGAVWLALYLARRITTPLRLVGEAAERIAAGERGARVDFSTGSDEFRALIGSFNRMSERLARSEEEVEFSRAGLAAQEPGAGGPPPADRGRARDRRHRDRRRRPGGHADGRERGGRSGCSTSSRAPSACRSSGCSRGPAGTRSTRSCCACSRAASRARSARCSCPRASATGTSR